MIAADRTARIFAIGIALVAATGLVLQFDVILTGHGSVAEALWVYLRFFTITTNMLVALAFGTIGIGGRHKLHPRLLGGLTLAILLVGIVYGLLLQGLHHLVGEALIADTLMHKIVPVLVPLYWLAAVPKGHIRKGDPLRWAIYPFAYLFYALARGLAGDRYAYPFIDPGKAGWAVVGINVALIAGGFLITGYLLAWIDRRLARRTVRA
ncbi:hypothetical protein SAMN05444678_1277 [Sphingomonas sp. YR710]|uniref:Pr6Pr family membrane protein n=1 Tax=Sphingomonas sp. YR710 TaxID=1882773 RepID=UPI00088EDD77|nr:Pr6Pr family membrane protein [Sphingomonas sp. YR710]SDD85829.1 hypothetical protein SAMN05444678_1277 [Sphingomonas sp. YR710]